MCCNQARLAIPLVVVHALHEPLVLAKLAVPWHLRHVQVRKTRAFVTDACRSILLIKLRSHTTPIHTGAPHGSMPALTLMLTLPSTSPVVAAAASHAQPGTDMGMVMLAGMSPQVGRYTSPVSFWSVASLAWPAGLYRASSPYTARDWQDGRSRHGTRHNVARSCCALSNPLAMQGFNDSRSQTWQHSDQAMDSQIIGRAVLQGWWAAGATCVQLPSHACTHQRTADGENG